MQQADHARLAREILALFRRPELVVHPRRESLLRAVAEHDNGWWESDSAPRRSPADTSRPLDFRELAEAERRELWRRGVDRFSGSDPAVAALVAAHGARLAAGRIAGDSDRAAFAEELARRRDELAIEAGIATPELAADDAWTRLADEISLAAVTGDATWVAVPGWDAEAELTTDGATLALSPFPLAGATTLSLSCRHLERLPRRSDSELARALASAPWIRRPVRIVPLSR